MRRLPTLHMMGEPAVLPDRVICRQSHYFIYIPHILSLMDSIINKHENLKQIHLCTIATQGMKKIFKDQMPTCLIFKKVYLVLVSKFSTVYHTVNILKNDKAKFKAVLRKFLHTHSFYSVDKCFTCKDDLLYCFVQCL